MGPQLRKECIAADRNQGHTVIRVTHAVGSRSIDSARASMTLAMVLVLRTCSAQNPRRRPPLTTDTRKQHSWMTPSKLWRTGMVQYGFFQLWARTEVAQWQQHPFDELSTAVGTCTSCEARTGVSGDDVGKGAPPV